jgi:hypothetical protein
VSAGSLRHFFPAHSDLLVYAMHLVVERIEARVAGLPATTSRRRNVEQRLQQLLPLDEELPLVGTILVSSSAGASPRHIAMARVSATSAAFDTLYAASPAAGRHACTEAMLMIDGRPRRSSAARRLGRLT